MPTDQCRPHLIQPILWKGPSLTTAGNISCVQMFTACGRSEMFFLFFKIRMKKILSTEMGTSILFNAINGWIRSWWDAVDENYTVSLKMSLKIHFLYQYCDCFEQIETDNRLYITQWNYTVFFFQTVGCDRGGCEEWFVGCGDGVTKEASATSKHHQVPLS